MDFTVGDGGRVGVETVETGGVFDVAGAGIEAGTVPRAGDPAGLQDMSRVSALA